LHKQLLIKIDYQLSFAAYDNNAAAVTGRWSTDSRQKYETGGPAAADLQSV